MLPESKHLLRKLSFYCKRLLFEGNCQIICVVWYSYYRIFPFSFNSSGRFIVCLTSEGKCFVLTSFGSLQVLSCHDIVDELEVENDIAAGVLGDISIFSNIH